MEEQRFESAYLLLRMVICQLVRQTLRKNHPKSLTDSDRWVVLPFDIKICLFFIQTRKKLPKQCVYIYLHTVYHICIREYICIYIYTSNPHQIHICPNTPSPPIHDFFSATGHLFVVPSHHSHPRAARFESLAPASLVGEGWFW